MIRSCPRPAAVRSSRRPQPTATSRSVIPSDLEPIGRLPEIAGSRRARRSGSSWQWIIPALALAVGLLLGPAQVTAQAPNNGDDTLCRNCHSDQVRLKALTLRWQRAYVDPTKFPDDAHSQLSCVECHGGNPTLDSQEACVGVAFEDPAAPEHLQSTCGRCHQEIAARHLKSIHSTVEGIRLSLVDLLGPEEGQRLFDGPCNNCHASCSSCHMEDPDHRDLLWPRVETHNITVPTDSTACRACHGATGDTFFGEKGEAAKHEPSPMAQAGLECMDCHNQDEVHGTGQKTSFVMESPKPECLECHGDPTARVQPSDLNRVAPQYATLEPAHAIHDESALSCSACHIEWYPSCWNCHQNRAKVEVEELYLAIDPLTNKVHTAVHSPPSAPDWGDRIPEEIGGGWAIKSRHSFGTSRTCEDCHARPEVYVQGKDRQAPFVGFWSAERANARLVDEATVQRLVINIEKLGQDVHGDLICADCHAVLSDQPCADCHRETNLSGRTVLGPDADWSRAAYLAAYESLQQAKRLIEQAASVGLATDDWLRQHSELRIAYLDVSNTFHGDPAAAQVSMAEVAQRSQGLRDNVSGALSDRASRQQGWLVGLPLAGGALAASVLGIVVYLPNRRKREG